MPKARKAINKLDKLARERILLKLREIEKLDNPRSLGKALTGKYINLWRYRMGD